MLKESRLQGNLFSCRFARRRNRELWVFEAYTGGDALLKGFERSLVWLPDASGAWAFDRFEGALSLFDKAFTFTYLPIKEKYKNLLP